MFSLSLIRFFLHNYFVCINISGSKMFQINKYGDLFDILFPSSISMSWLLEETWYRLLLLSLFWFASILVRTSITSFFRYLISSFWALNFNIYIPYFTVSFNSSIFWVKIIRDCSLLCSVVSGVVLSISSFLFCSLFPFFFWTCLWILLSLSNY